MRRSLRHSPTARHGFTLVEMLVAAALSIMIMAIMATAFTIALDTLSQLKSVATIAEDLRSAETIVGRDLKAQHLEDESGAVVRVSDSQVSNGSWNGNGRGGFLRVRQGSPIRQNTSTGIAVGVPTYPAYIANPNHPYIQEGIDSSDNVTPSYRATDHSLHFTVKLSGKTPQDVFSAKPPPGMPIMPSLVDQNPDATQFVGKWAEVAYFLKPTIGQQQTKTDNNLPGITLFTLYRLQRILSPVDTSFTTATPAQFVALYPECSLVVPPGPPNTVNMNTPATIAAPGNRLNLNLPSAALPSMPFGSAGYGTDVLLTNVISFQVRLLVDPVPTPFANDATNPTSLFVPANATIPAWQYDTADPLPPGGGKLKPRAVQIKLRVYEPKNRLTRQITITHDL